MRYNYAVLLVISDIIESKKKKKIETITALKV